MPAPVRRDLISRGPALVKFDGAIFYSAEDITLDWAFANASVPSAAFGDVFPYRTGLEPTLTVPLVGEVEHLDKLFPFGAMVPGKSIFGVSDTPLDIVPLDVTQPVTRFACAALNVEPELRLGVTGGVALGSTGFAFLPRQGAQLDDPSAWYTTVANDPGYITGFDPAKILIQSPDISWLSGGTMVLSFDGDPTAALAYNVIAGDLQTALNGLAAITNAGGVTVTGDVREGWVVTFDTDGVVSKSITGVLTGMPGGTALTETVVQAGTAELPHVVLLRLTPWHWVPNETAVVVRTAPQFAPQVADAQGRYDIVFSGTSATARFIPLNIQPDVLAAAANVQGPGARLGANLATGAHNLVMDSPGLHVTLYGAIITQTGGVWSATRQRVPETEWTSSRTLAGGAISPAYRVAATA